MECKNVRELLYDYTKNETAGAVTADIKGHLASCTACSTELKNIMDLKNIFKAGLADVPVNSIVAIREHMKKPAALRLFLKPVFAVAAVFLIAGTLLINGVVSYNKSAELDDFLDDSYKIVDHSDCYDVISASYSEDIEQEVY
jgi:hypothetical protein